MKKSIVKLGVSLAATLMIGSSSVGLTSVKADDVEKISNSTLSSKDDIRFAELVDSGFYSNNQINQILIDKSNISSQPQPRWKVAVLKKMVEYGAKLVGAKLGEKTTMDFVNYLTGFEDNLQQGLENGLVRYCHVNRTVAKWAAKTVIFVFL